MGARARAALASVGGLMARLSVEDVRHSYGERAALRGVAFRVEAGELVALVGPNGAGKSTLLRIAAGRLRPSGGRVLLDGDDVAGLSALARARRISGVAAAEEGRFPFSVREAVALGRHPWRGRFAPLSAEDTDAVEAALVQMELAPLADRRIDALSSGERQRVALARCLAQRADVLLLDEPTAHLDLGHALRTLARLRSEAHDGGRAVLAALHDLGLAAAFADRVALLHDGALVAHGPPRDALSPARVAEAFGAAVAFVDHPGAVGPALVPLAGGGA
jgi:iron complex transport system ATP-binding protein